MNVDLPTIVKYPWETPDYTADFSELGEVVDGQTLTIPDCVQIDATPGLTIGAAALNATAVSDGHGGEIPALKGVQARLSGGTSGDEFVVEYRMTLSPSGAKRARRFKLVIL